MKYRILWGIIFVGSLIMTYGLGDEFSLQKEYEQLCDERGAFFKWSLVEKMEYANSLPTKLENAQEMKETVKSDFELETIANYGFCIPTEECISQKQALSIAINVTKERFDLPDNWETQSEIYYSFFVNDESDYIWRVIFWKVRNEKYPSGIVDLNAIDGNVLRIERNGNTAAEYIPYLDRI